MSLLLAMEIGAVLAGLGAARYLRTGHGQILVGRLAKFCLPSTLFTRLAGDELLKHAPRNALYAFVLENPGARLFKAEKALSFSEGSLRHHARMLAKGEIIRLEKARGVARLFPKGSPRRVMPVLGDQQESVLGLLKASPGISQNEIGLRLGMSKRVISYHVGVLRSGGLVNVVRQGKAHRCYAAS